MPTIFHKQYMNKVLAIQEYRLVKPTCLMVMCVVATLCFETSKATKNNVSMINIDLCYTS